jgi:hypothetical protein
VSRRGRRGFGLDGFGSGDVMHFLLKSFQSLADPLSDLREFPCAENNQHDDQDNDQL